MQQEGQHVHSKSVQRRTPTEGQKEQFIYQGSGIHEAVSGRVTSAGK